MNHTSLKGSCQSSSDFCSVTLCAMLPVSQQNNAQFQLPCQLTETFGSVVTPVDSDVSKTFSTQLHLLPHQCDKA